MSNYVVPQVQVFQEFRQIPQQAVRNLNAFVFGPHYALFRYAETGERQHIGVGEYLPALGGAHAWPGKSADTVVDQAYAKLFAESAELRYCDLPASAADPVFIMSASERTKLRAAPRITNGGVFPAASGVTLSFGGMHTGKTDLPEAYYFVPSATFQVGGPSAAAGVVDYATSKGFQGSVAVPADAATAGKVVAGPDGMALDFSVSGTPAAVKSPRAIEFRNAAGTQSFTMSLLRSALPAVVDDALGLAANALKVSIDSDAAVLSATWSGSSLAINYRDTDTLAGIREMLLDMGGKFDDMFSISTLTGVGDADEVVAVDQDGVAVSTAITIVPVAWKSIAHANSITFKTANGFTRSSFLGKDVEIGDKVEWAVTAENGDELSGKFVVKSLVADRTAPVVGAAIAADTYARSYGDDLAIPETGKMAPGADNQKKFDGANTKVGTVLTDIEERIPSYAGGVVSETITATVTRAGKKAGNLAGSPTALFRVESSSGLYRRTGEPLQDSANDGKLYLGCNLFIDFDAGAFEDGSFAYGDKFVIGPVNSSWRPAEGVMASGGYTGSVDTEYSVEVVRGGLFERAAVVLPLATAPSAATQAALHASLGEWTGGEVDDEYRLVCVTGGTITSAVFQLKSQLGDDSDSVVFPSYGEGNYVKAGRKSLKLWLEDKTGAASHVFVAGADWSVVVRAARPQVRITDSAGTSQEVTALVTPDNSMDVGFNGVSIVFPPNSNYMAGVDNALKGGLLTGERFTIAATASKDGPVKTLVLSGDLPATASCALTSAGLPVKDPSPVSIALSMVENLVAIPRENRDPAVAPGQFNFTTSQDLVTIAPDIKVTSARVELAGGVRPYLPLRHANMLVEHRDLLRTHAGSIFNISDIGLVESDLGVIHPDNPLAMGVHKAMQNCGDRTLYYSAVDTDDQKGFRAVLSKAGLTSDVYAFCPLTENISIHQDVAAHVADLSSEINKRWRIAFVGTKMPDIMPVVNASTHPSGLNWTATVERDTRPGKFGAVTKIVLTSDDAKLLERVRPGDKARIQFATDPWGNPVFSEIEVAEVGSDTAFYVRTPLAAVSASPQRVEVWHPLTVSETAQEVADISSRYASRRMYHVFPERLEDGDFVLPAFYGAAAVAGLCSSVVPQQGLTNIAVNGFSQVPVAYSMFSYEDLNTIAGGGTLIIMQETRNSEIFVRHQISTAYSQGNLNTSELSLTKNLDAISYYFANLLRPYIGRYNVTPELLMVLTTEVNNALSYLGSFTRVGLLGPQLILENGKSALRTLQQHPTLKDRVYAVLDLEMPYPLNVIELHLVV
jgi:hypothetical protein